MNLNQYRIRQLHSLTREALNRLYLEDNSLLNRSGLEQSIAFRFGIYFHSLINFHSLIKDTQWLSRLDLDMEYNKNGNDSKRTPSKPNGARPDFILHSRGNNENNVLIIEFKGWWDKRQRVDDRKKLLDFTNPEGGYAYGLGILVEFNKNNFELELIGRDGPFTLV